MDLLRRLLVAGVVVALVVLAFLVFRNRSPQAPMVGRIGYLNIAASLPLFIAEANGYFAEEGVQAETVEMATSDQLVEGIVAGDLDVLIEASAVPVLAAELQSPGTLKVFSVSSITKEAPFDTVLVREDSALANLQDLAGKTIGVFPGSTATNLLKKFLDDSGIDTANITFVPIPPENQLTALLEGSVDAVHAYEPTTAIALSHEGVRDLYGSVYAAMLDRNPQGVAAVSASFLEERPEAATGVIRALERGMVFMREEEAEARQILGSRLKLEPEVSNRSVFLYMLPHEQVDTAIFQKYADMLIDVGELGGSVDMNTLLYRE